MTRHPEHFRQQARPSTAKQAADIAAAEDLLRRTADAYGYTDPDGLVAEARRYSLETGRTPLAAIRYVHDEIARQWAES